MSNYHSLSNLSEIGSVKSVALGSIFKGNSVSLNSDGTVSVSKEDEHTWGSEVLIRESDNDYYGACLYPDTAYDELNNNVIIVYRMHPNYTNGDYGYVQVGTVTGTSISFGDPVVFSSVGVLKLSVEYHASEQKIVIVWSDTASPFAGKAIVGIIDGDDVDFGPVSQFDQSYFYNHSSFYHPKEENILVACQNDQQVGNMLVMSIEYNPAFGGTGYWTDVGSYYQFGVIISGYKTSYGDPSITFTYDDSTDRTVVTYKDMHTSNYTYAPVAEVTNINGTALSFSGRYQIDSSNIANGGVTSVFDPVTNRIVWLYTDNGGSGVFRIYARVGRAYSSSGIIVYSEVTFQDTASVSFKDVNIIYDPPSGDLVALWYYENDVSSNYYIHHSRTRVETDIDNDTLYAPQWADLGQWSTGETEYLNTVYDPYTNQIFAIWRRALAFGAPFENKWSLRGQVLDPGGRGHDGLLGVSYNSASNGELVDIATDGAIATIPANNLTIGSDYWIADNGDLQNSDSGNPKIGRAIATDKIIINKSYY